MGQWTLSGPALWYANAWIKITGREEELQNMWCTKSVLRSPPKSDKDQNGLRAPLRA